MPSRLELVAKPWPCSAQWYSKVAQHRLQKHGTTKHGGGSPAPTRAAASAPFMGLSPTERPMAP